MLFAPPEVLSAYSYAVDGSDPDEPLPKGTHFRIFSGLGGVFPLAPFAVFKVHTGRSEPNGVQFIDTHGGAVGGGDLSGYGTLELAPSFGDSDTRRTVQAELYPYPLDTLEEVQLLDTQRRVVAERRKPPFLFSAPTLSRFRLRGAAHSVALLTRTVDIDTVLSARVASDLLGLPISGLFPWYLGVHDRQHAFQRVTDAAPTLLNPMDRPDGPFEEVGFGPNDEEARIEAMLAFDRFGGGLEKLVSAIVGDDSQVPWQQLDKEPLEGTRQIAIVPRLGRMQLAALDPGLARFLGFAGRIDDLPDFNRSEGWTALAVIGFLAVDPKLGDKLPLIDGWLKSPDPDQPALLEMIRGAIQTFTGVDPAGDFDLLRTHAKDRGLLVRTAVSVTAPLPPWLPPTLPEPTILDHSWQSGNGVDPSSLYRATFTFPHAPLAALAAVAANLEGAWTSRHGSVDVGAFTPPQRAIPRLFGHETESSSRVRSLLRPGDSAALQAAGLLADENLPAQEGRLTYRFHASDFFGRFGAPTETSIEPPPRPPPPPPVLRYRLDLLQDGLEELAKSGKLSPGVLRVTFAVPEPSPAPPFSAADEGALRTAVLVPGINDLAAGSLRIATASVTFDGIQKPTIDLASPGIFAIDLPLPPLDPQERREATLAAYFTDSDGTDSHTTTALLTVVDKRPLEQIETGVALFWTSAPGPAPDVQLKLKWQGAANSRFRIYSTDQQGLGLTDAELHEHVAGAAPSRGRVAEVGCNKVLNGAAIDRKVFRLLTDTIQADATGQAILETTLPRSLETVQFLRVVPLSSEGAEAPFDTCGIVPVAVPDSRRPPLPRLEGSVDPETGNVTLGVTADGFDEVTLHRDEPGLFEPGAAGTVAPTFRVRRAVDAIADPIYAREVAHGDLARKDGVFAGVTSDTNDGRGLEPFVKYVYWADVRLPPERRLPANVQPFNAGFDTVDPANATDYPRPMSLPSAPRTLMRTPTEAPAAPEAASISASKVAMTTGNVELTIQISDPPVAHAKAIGPYRLAAWTQWPDQSIQPITNADGVELASGLPELTDAPITVAVAAPTPPGDIGGQLVLRLAFVDPTGRTGALTTLTVT